MSMDVLGAVAVLVGIAVVSIMIRERRERREDERRAAARRNPQFEGTLAMLAAMRWILGKRTNGPSTRV